MFNFLKNKMNEQNDFFNYEKEILNLKTKIKLKDEDINKLNELVKNQLETITSLNNQIENFKSADGGSTSEPLSLATISIFELNDILRKLKINRISLSDDVYSLTSMEQAKKYVKASGVFKRKWVKDKHDCDNFSYELLGYWSKGLESFAFGYARSNNHAFNIMLDNNKVLWLCEPQTNVWIKYEENKDSKYKITEVLI